MIAPTSPYWPLKGWVEYNHFKIASGKFNPATLGIEVTGASVLTDKFRRTHVTVPGVQYPCVAVLDTRPGVVPNPDWSNVDKTLYQGLYKGAKFPSFIGESGDISTFGWVPEPELTIAPVAGEELSGRTDGHGWDKNTGEDRPDGLSWKYRTLGLSGPGKVFWWDQFPDQVMTGLQERPENPEGWVYNYLFARDVGMINFWWGWKRADNTMDPSQFWQWQITSRGN